MRAAFLVIFTILALQAIFFSQSAVQGLPVTNAEEDDLELLDTSANTIIFRPLFVYRLQQRRLKEKREKLKRLRAQSAAANQLE